MFLKHHSFLRIFVFGRCIYQASVLSFVGKGPVADPDLQISGGEGGGGRGGVRVRSQKNFFRLFGPQFGLIIRGGGGGGGGGGLPWIRH